MMKNKFALRNEPIGLSYSLGRRKPYLVLISCWLLCTFCLGMEKLTVYPETTLVYENRSMEILCCQDEGELLAWMANSVEMNEEKWLFTGFVVVNTFQQQGFNVTKSSKGCFKIMNSKVQLEYAGKYVCKSLEGRVEAQLIVLESEPRCFTNKSEYPLGVVDNVIDPEEVDSLWCSVEYRGFTDPVFSWITEDGISLSVTKDIKPKGKNRILESKHDPKNPDFLSRNNQSYGSINVTINHFDVWRKSFLISSKQQVSKPAVSFIITGDNGLKIPWVIAVIIFGILIISVAIVVIGIRFKSKVKKENQHSLDVEAMDNKEKKVMIGDNPT